MKFEIEFTGREIRATGTQNFNLIIEAETANGKKVNLFQALQENY